MSNTEFAITSGVLVQGRRFERIVVATHNPGKLREISELLAPYAIETVSAGALGLPEPEEDAPDFAGNALIKARAACAGAGLPALADDSGLVVPALGGAPGIYSARWAGPKKDFAAAMARVEQELNEVNNKDRSAYFVCALALVWPDGQEKIFEGRVDGGLVFPPRGDLGFGYDPIFRMDGEILTFGEMAQDRKHKISHRARAFQLLVQHVIASPGQN